MKFEKSDVEILEVKLNFNTMKIHFCQKQIYHRTLCCVVQKNNAILFWFLLISFGLVKSKINLNNKCKKNIYLLMTFLSLKHPKFEDILKHIESSILLYSNISFTQKVSKEKYFSNFCNSLIGFLFSLSPFNIRN